MNWAEMTKPERLALCQAHPRQQAHVARLAHTTSSAVGGFMSRNAAALGIVRAPAQPNRRARKGTGRDPNWDEQLTERWAARKKDEPAPAPVPSQHWRVTRWTPEMKAQLAVDWNKGLSVRLIARKLGVGDKAVVKQRIAQKLKARRPRGGGQYVHQNITLSPEDYILLRDGADRRGSTMNDYIGFLLRRDAGKEL